MGYDTVWYYTSQVFESVDDVVARELGDGVKYLGDLEFSDTWEDE